MYELLKRLTNVMGVSGREEKAGEVLSSLIAPYTDSVGRDTLGNIIAVRKGVGDNPKKVLLCAHMDEIGFFVTCVEENGYLRVAPVGGISFGASAYAEVISENGVRGVLAQNQGCKGNATFDQFYIDIGARDRKDAEKKVRVGDSFRVVPALSRLLHKRVCGRPLDDRIGCAILIKIAEKLMGQAVDADVYFVFSVQEEVGCRGAKTAAFAIRPDEAIAYDVTLTGDVPGAKPMECSIGGGAAIKLKDSSLICDQSFCRELAELAKEKKIPYQYEILTGGGTDTSSIQVSASGCRATALSVASRYVHTGMELCDLSDAAACVDLTVAYLGK